MKLETKNVIKGYLFVSIWIIGFLIFTLYPLVQTLLFSFHKVKFTAEGISTIFIGLENYKNLFLLDVSFSDVITDYIVQILIYVPIIIVFSMIAALLLNTDIKGKGIFRTIYFLPVIITSGPVMQNLLEQNATALPGIEKYLSVNYLYNILPAFFVNIINQFFSSFIMILWFSGVQILIFLAGLQKLDKSIYEAARIDGASKWQIFWKLTLPSLLSVTTVNVVYTIVSLSIFPLNGVVSKIISDMYEITRGIGYASALSWVYFIIILIILGITIKIINIKENGQEVK